MLKYLFGGSKNHLESRNLVNRVKIGRYSGETNNEAICRQEFEAYLYQQSPLCSRCTVLVKGMSRDPGGGVELKEQSSSSKSRQVRKGH